jgi:hypothetical protein
MTAVGITLAIFACWCVVGYALTSTFLVRRQALANMLLAPTIGMSVLELAAFIGLRFGSPVGPIAHAIVLGALALAVVVLLVRRPPIPFRRALPFGLILLVAIPLTSWPLFRWGGDWVANANEDMGNYCLGATGYRDHGYFSLHADEYFSGKDLTYEVWFLYGDGVGHRHGGELSLAMTSAMAEQPVPFIFMPVILAMQLALISAVGFLMYRLADGRTVALLTCGFMVVSPLATFSIVQQLFAQVGGLAILVAGAGLFLRPARKLPALGWIKRGVLGGITAAALLLHYIEVAPFLVAGFGLHITIGFARGRRDFKQIAIAILAATLTVPLLGSFILANISYLLLQTAPNRNQQIHEIMCPMFLNTGGCPRLWGLALLHAKIELAPDSPWPVHRLVMAGGFYLLLTLAAGIALAWRRRPVAEILLVMVGVAILFLRGRAAFSLLKLALFAQPFILGSLILGWSRMKPGRWKQAGAICLATLLPLQILTQQKYVSVSVKSPSAGWETPGATQERLWSQYRDALQTPGVERFFVPVNDLVSRRILGCCGRNVTVYSPCSAQQIQAHPLDLEGIHRSGWGTQWHELRNSPYRGYNQGVMIDSFAKSSASIALLDAANPGASANLTFDLPSWLDRPGTADYLIDPPQRFSLFNRFHRSTETRQCRVLPIRKASNYLFWRPTSRSLPFNNLMDAADSIGLHRLQIDNSFPLDTMAASGRYLTFQVFNPSPKVRMLVECTSTTLLVEEDVLPAAVVGEERVPLPISGRGASRVISEPLSVQQVGDCKFVVLDLGRTPPPFEAAKSPWGSETRPISMYIRDVSLLSEGEYAALTPPEGVKSFPAGLSDKRLIFWGCGEDGSVGKQSWFRLSRPESAGSVAVRGEIPHVDAHTITKNQLQVKWNGVEIGQKMILSGQFEFRVPLPASAGPGRLELLFSNSWPLQRSTNNSLPPTQTSAVLSFIGFE